MKEIKDFNKFQRKIDYMESTFLDQESGHDLNVKIYYA